MKTLTIAGKEVSIIDVSMGHANGYGQYNIIAEYKIDGQKYSYSFHSTDSETYDQLRNEDLSVIEKKEMLYYAIEHQLLNLLEDAVSNIILENE